MKKFLIILIIGLLLFPAFADGQQETAQTINNILPGLITNTTNSQTDEIGVEMAELERLYRYVNESYYGDIDNNKTYEAMASALFSSLDDPYSYFVPKDSTDDYLQVADGIYAGIGIEFTKTILKYQEEDDINSPYCKISTIFPGTPAKEVGLRVGDYITMINGDKVDGLEATECADKMKGEEGSQVTITILRGDKTFDVTLTRKIVKIPTVDFCTIDNDTYGYIYVSQFAESTNEKFNEALADFKAKGINKIIIDLRDNGGGDITVALAMVDNFISNKKLLTIKYKDNSQGPQVLYANEGTTIPDSTKLVLLVNGGSASSSEIVTGILKDYKRAEVIGEKTFGKGCMQTIVPFSGSYTSLTTAHFYTPSMNEIHDVGIEPDIEAEALIFTDDEYEVYLKLFEKEVISKYVDENPDFTDENIKDFVLPEGYGEIRPLVLENCVRNEYLSRLDTDNRLRPNPDYDPVLKRAFEYFNTGE